MTTPSIDRLLEELHAYVKASEANIGEEEDNGATADVNARVSTLCQQIAQLDREQAKAYEPQLTEALAAVEGLQKKLEEQQQKTLDALGNVKQHSAAVSAYAKNIK